MFAILYSKNTGRLRQVIRSDTEFEFKQTMKHIIQHDGVGIMYVPDNKFSNNPEVLQNLITSSTGKIPKDDNYVILDKQNKVIGSFIGDLSCGDGIGLNTFKSNSFKIGMKYNNVLNKLEENKEN